MVKTNHTLELGLLENSHRFLNEAASKAMLAKGTPDQWMFAVSALVQSVELALKAALAEIHPIFIYEDIDAPKRTVTINSATERLASREIGKYEFTKQDLTRLKRATNMRNELTHSNFTINFAHAEANFHEVFAFLTEFNRRLFSINMDDIVDPAYLVEFLENRKHHQEMLSRALTRIKDEKIEIHLLRSCSYCSEDTFVEELESCKCYLCHHQEELVQCLNCANSFLESEMEDFSGEFDGDYSEGLYEIYNNYGYDFHIACMACVPEIKQTIHSMAEQDHYDQMREEQYYEQMKAEIVLP